MRKALSAEDKSLIDAAIRGDAREIADALARGANVNAEEEEHQMTALQFAAAFGHESATRLLLESGADVNHIDQNMDTALGSAVSNSHQSIVRLLLAHGADVTVENGAG